jgi:hypothetical protein
VHQSLHSNGRGAYNSERIIALLPSNDKRTLVLLLLRGFRGFYGSNSYRMGKTRHNIQQMFVQRLKIQFYHIFYFV